MVHTKRKRKNGTKNIRKKRHLQINKRKKLSGRLHIEGRLDGGPRLQRKHKEDEKRSKAKQNKTHVTTPEKDVMASANQTPGGYKFAPLVAIVNKGERTSTSPLALGYHLLVLPVTFGHTTACRSPALVFSATIHFAMKCPAPCSAVLRHSPSSWAVVVHWSALMPKALRSSRKHPMMDPLFFLAPHTASAPHHFSELCATNLANKIRFLRKVASMLSLPVLISVSR